MKKKTVLILITLCFSLSIVCSFSTSAQATQQCKLCKVIFAGSTFGSVKIRLYIENTEKWFFVGNADFEKEILAVALTAAANNQPAYVCFQDNYIYQMYLYNMEYKK